MADTFHVSYEGVAMYVVCCVSIYSEDPIHPSFLQNTDTCPSWVGQTLLHHCYQPLGTLSVQIYSRTGVNNPSRRFNPSSPIDFEYDHHRRNTNHRTSNQ